MEREGKRLLKFNGEKMKTHGIEDSSVCSRLYIEVILHKTNKKL